MATDQERLVLQMSADFRAFEREMARGRQITERRMREVEQRALQADKNLKRIMQGAGRSAVEGLREGLSGIAPTIAAAFSAQAVVAYADAWTQGRNALAAAGIATEDLADRQSQLVDLANETRTSTEATIELYARLTRATSELGLTQGDVLRLTELLNKSFASSGLSTQEAASAALQLSQALASGSLQGDELRSLRENAPAVAQAIADAMGVGIGALKDLGAEGKLTASVVSSAILGAADDIETRFGATTTTVGQAMTILNNELGRFVGSADQSVSATALMAQAIVGLANNLDKLVPVVAALATFFGVRYAGGLAVASAQMIAAGINTARLTAFNIGMTASLTGATRAQVALNLAMAANPVGAVITVVAALAAGLALLATRYNSTAVAARELDQVVGSADASINEYRQAVDRARAASGEERKELLAKAAALREVTRARINDARVAAQKQIDEAIAARARADAAIGRSADARATAFSNPNNANAALAAGASSQARANITLATRAREEADRAIQAWRRLDGLVSDIENPSPSAGGGGGAVGDVGGPRIGGSSDADRTAELRDQLDLEERMSRARATGNDALVKAEEERQRIIELTERYRSAGYEDAVFRALQMVALENEATAIAEERERIEAQGAERLERVGDKLEKLRAAAEEEADRLERLDAEQEYTARNAARTFVDVIASDDPWEAAGQAFRRAAFNNLEDLFTGLFKQMMSGNAGQTGNFFAGFAKAFAGGFAGGGTMSPGQWAVVGERGAEAIRALPGGGVSVLSNGNLKGLQAGSAQRVVNQTIVLHAEGAVLAEGLIAQARAEAIQITGLGLQSVQAGQAAQAKRSEKAARYGLGRRR